MSKRLIIELCEMMDSFCHAAYVQKGITNWKK
jgi:hypothetical protein